MKCNLVCVNLSSLFRKCCLMLKLFCHCLSSCDIMKGSEIDRISALPEPILQHILSFLPFKQAAQSCLVSKKFEKAWHTLPVLRFDESVFTLELWRSDPNSRGKTTEARMRRKKLFDRLEKLLEDRQKEFISIQKLQICMEISNQEELVSFIDRCIGYAIESNVKELKLDFLTWGNRWYNVPGNVFCANSIDILELRGCKIESRRSNVMLNSLRKLCLHHVYVEDYVIENLIGGCPLIENLEVVACRGFKILKLLNLSYKLSTIKITYTSELEHLEINALNAHSIELGDLSEGQCEINLAPCKKLKTLKLFRLLVSDEWLYNQVSQLPILEYLFITFCKNLRSMNISSPCLKTLSIDKCMKLVAIKISTPNLTSFKYKGDIFSFSSNSSDFSETDLFIIPATMDTQWHAKYIELLAKFNRSSIVLHLQSDVGQNMIIPTELRQILPSTLSNVKHLNYTINDKLMRFAISRVLDGLLWISPHAETISINYGCKKSTFQFSYKKQPVYEGEIVCCCKTLPISCWRHCIKQVKIEDTYRNNVKKCFTVNKDFLKKIDDIYDR